MLISIDQLDIPDDIKNAIRGSKALVTGGTGMIGREVVRLLLDLGCDVTSVSLDDLRLDERASYVKANLSDFKACQDLVSDKDYVFHVAGIKGSVVVTKEKPASFFVPLLQMNTNILEASRLANVNKVVYVSSIGAYSPAEVFSESESDFSLPPMDMFPGWAKRMAELQVEAYKIQYGLNNFSIVRPSNIYGPGDNFDEKNAMVIPSLMSKVARGDNPVKIWGDGSAERDFLHSTDAARGIIYACIRGTNSKALNLGCGYGISISCLVEALQKIVPFTAYFDTAMPGGFPRRIMDMTRAKEELGFVPSIKIFDGLKNTWDWYLKNKSEHLMKQNYFK